MYGSADSSGPKSVAVRSAAASEKFYLDHIWERYLYQYYEPCKHTCDECKYACCEFRRAFMEKDTLGIEIGADRMDKIASLLLDAPTAVDPGAVTRDAMMQLLRWHYNSTDMASFPPSWLGYASHRNPRHFDIINGSRDRLR